MRLGYREGQFSPTEVAAITGLSMTLQRDWRSQGHLKPRTGGRASFSPRELAEIGVMVQLRGLGLPLPESRRIAQEAAPSLLTYALSSHGDKTLALDASPDRAASYLETLQKGTEGGFINFLSGLPLKHGVYRFAHLKNGECRLLYHLDDEDMDDDIPASGLVNLWAIAKIIAKTAPRPMFTLVVPADFR